MINNKLNYSVLVSLTIFLIVQTCTVVWWASSLSTSMHYMQLEVFSLKTAVKEQTTEQAKFSRLTLDTMVANTTLITEMKLALTKLDKRIYECEKRLNEH
jgi:hypothetical protein